MSRLDELIHELCPDGVEYHKFSELCDYVRGVTYNKSQEANNGDLEFWKILRANNITLQDNVLNLEDVKLVKKSVKIKPSQFLKAEDILICAGSGSKEHVGKVAYIYHDMDYLFGGFMAVIRCSNKLVSRYLYHILTSSEFKKHLSFALNSTTINNLNASVMADFSFPVPPLPVQQEIVRILDSFTELTAELTEELEARKKQYEYYKEIIIHSSCNEKMYTLDEICSIVDCPHSSPTWQETGIPVIRNYNLIDGAIDTSRLSYVSENEYVQRTKRIVPKENDIMFSREAPIGNVGIVPANFQCCQGQRVVLLRPNMHTVYPRFLLHYLQSADVKKQVNQVEGIGATVSNFGIGSLKQLKICLPTMDKQIEIANILDDFSEYCSDVKSGLPAEIAARQRQYEYYRDKLLSFN